jgi:nucleoside-diphosphate-sugar epimerase
MTILVTGGAGFIGGEVVRLALDRGESVRVLDSLRPDVHAAPAGPEGGVPDPLPDPLPERTRLRRSRFACGTADRRAGPCLCWRRVCCACCG